MASWLVADKRVFEEARIQAGQGNESVTVEIMGHIRYETCQGFLRPAIKALWLRVLETNSGYCLVRCVQQEKAADLEATEKQQTIQEMNGKLSLRQQHMFPIIYTLKHSNAAC